MRGDPSDHEPEDPQGSWDPRGLWQAQEKEYDAMTLVDIHERAVKFQKRIQARNAREFIACGVVMLGFVPAIFLHYHWLTKVGAAWIIFATAYVAWQLQRRASLAPPAAPGETLVDAYRRQLIRQRDAVRTIASWYLAPMMPGVALFSAGMWLQTPRPGVPIGRFHVGLLIQTAVWLGLFALVWWLNRRAVGRLQKKIDEL